MVYVIKCAPSLGVRGINQDRNTIFFRVHLITIRSVRTMGRSLSNLSSVREQIIREVFSVSNRTLSTSNRIRVTTPRSSNFSNPFFNNASMLLRYAMFVSLRGFQPSGNLFSLSSTRRPYRSITIVSSGQDSSGLDCGEHLQLTMCIRQYTSLFSATIINSSSFVNRFSNFVLIINSGSANGTSTISHVLRPITRFLTSLNISNNGKLVRRRSLKVQYRDPNGNRTLTLATKRLIKVTLFRTQRTSRISRFRSPLPCLLFQPLLSFRTRNSIVRGNRVTRRNMILRSRTSTPLNDKGIISPTTISRSITTIKVLRTNRRTRGHHLTTTTKARRNSRLTLISTGKGITQHIRKTMVLFSIFRFSVRRLRLLCSSLSTLTSEGIQEDEAVVTGDAGESSATGTTMVTSTSPS